MPSAPPALAQASLIGPSSQITRRVDLYEEDGETPFMLNAPVVDGSISVDGTRDERRTLDAILDNTDGALDNYPGGFWYDKIIKTYRGIVWEGLTSSTVRTYLRSLYGLSLDGTAGTYASTPWTGSTPKGLYMPGTTQHYASTPNYPSLNVADIDVSFRLAVDWSVSQVPVAKWSSGGNKRSWYVYCLNTGIVRLTVDTTGDFTVVRTALSTVAHPFAVDEGGWIRVTRLASSGETKFYTAPDSLDKPTVWTQLGATVMPGAGAPFAADLPLYFGGLESGANNTIKGVLRRVVLLDGINGTVVFDIDFTSEAQGWAVGDSNGATGTDATGKVVTISGADSKILSTFDLIGDLDLVAQVAPVDWTPGTVAAVAFYSKLGTVTGYEFGLYPDGKLVLSWGNGSTYKVVTSTVATGFADGSMQYTRVTLDINNGASGHDVRFYTSIDGIAWNQLGTTVTTAGVTTIALNTESLRIGSRPNGLYPLIGTLGLVRIRDGINGPIVASPDFDEPMVGTTSFSDSKGNVWTLSGNAAIVDTGVDVADGYIQTSDSPGQTLTSNILHLRGKIAPEDWTPATIQTVISKWSTAFNDRTFKFSLLSTGILRLMVSTNGTNELTLDSTIAVPGVINGQPLYVGVDFYVNNTAGGKSAVFLYGNDGISYTQLGSPVTSNALGTTALYDGGQPIRIGATAEGEYFLGHMYEVGMYDDLRIVLELDLTGLTAGQQGVMDPNTGTGFNFVGTGIAVTGGEVADQSWETQIGEFLIDRIDTDNFPYQTKVTARDYTKKLLEDKFSYATTFAQGLAVEAVIKAIAQNGGITKFVMPATGQTLGRDFTFEAMTERWKACKEIATAYGYDLFFDPQGYLTLEEFRDPVSSPRSFTFETGQFGTLAKYSKASTDTRLYNRVVVRGEATNTIPITSVAENHQASSPVSIENLGRVKTYNFTSSWITTQEQADAVARVLLRIHSLESFELSLTSIVIPWLEAGHIIEFVDPSPNPGDPDSFLLSSFTIPLKLGTMDAVAKRVTVVS